MVFLSAGNMNWISCKIIASGIESVVDDFAMCTECIRCPELRLVQETLLLLKPAVSSVHSPEGNSHVRGTERDANVYQRKEMEFSFLCKSTFLRNYNQ